MAMAAEEARRERLRAAAERARREAEARRAGEEPAPRPREEGGRAGPEPVRFGDWEKQGRAIDF